MTRSQINQAAIQADLNASNSPLQGADFRVSDYYIGHTVCPFADVLEALNSVAYSAKQSMESQTTGTSFAEAYYSANQESYESRSTIRAWEYSSFGAVTGSGVDWDVHYVGNGMVAVSVAFERFGSIVENMVVEGWTPGPCKLAPVDFRAEMHPAHVGFLEWCYDGDAEPTDWELENVSKKALARKYGWHNLPFRTGEWHCYYLRPRTEHMVRTLSKFDPMRANAELNKLYKEKLGRRPMLDLYNMLPERYYTSIGVVLAKNRSAQTLHFEGVSYTAKQRWGVKYIKVQGMYFLWFDEFDKHAEGRSFREAFTILKDRLNGWIVGKKVSLARVVKVHRYCLPGTRQWLLSKFPHIGRLLEPYQRWEDVPQDIMQIEWDFASRELFDGRV